MGVRVDAHDDVSVGKRANTIKGLLERFARNKISDFSLLRPIFRGCVAVAKTSTSNRLGCTVELGSTSKNEHAVLDDVFFGDPAVLNDMLIIQQCYYS